jgi:hypothetical protein
VVIGGDGLKEAHSSAAIFPNQASFLESSVDADLRLRQLGKLQQRNTKSQVVLCAQNLPRQARQAHRQASEGPSLP